MTRNLQHRHSIQEIRLRIAGGRLALGIALLSVTLQAPLTHAQTLTVLYNFRGRSDGSLPQAALIRDPTGNLYGTTTHGGIPGCAAQLGCGTVFKLDTAGRLIVLHAFHGWPDYNGSFPNAPLIRLAP